ncbi:MAG TPA: nicotinate phosphoribosyltransferase [Rhodanobacteraceae bacterium]|jgi:nicotinamide phosphoribosyltransferase|nr:nicotinate phosphoribosyltransferase [Rhodanobacteraceae bacterium]
MQFLDNPILNSDSYKASHWLQYPPGVDATFFYLESRGGEYERTVFFGLQSILKEYFGRPITTAMVDEAQAFFAAHGEPFNADGWRHIVDVHGGRLPLRIRAVPEGTVVPTHQALVTVESTDPACFWLPSYVETMLMRAWYPVTVATISWHVKQCIRAFLDKTSDDPAGQVLFKLHDFGARGVSSSESAALGGMAHLVNFRGTDTVLAVLAAREYYGEAMAGYSIPATEHSTITAWGRERELDAYRNVLRQFAKPGSVVACVSDSYDLFNAVENMWGGALREEVIKSGATLVVRPDSGDPTEIVHQTLKLLNAAFGSTVNGKGYRVLNHVRVIQGDGVNPDSIRLILERMTRAGYAADNIAFGMGGALLQKLNRDTQKFALKCSAAHIDGRWIDVFKDPVTDHGKASKRGRLTLARHRQHGTFKTVVLPEGAIAADAATLGPGWEDAMQTVWEDGQLRQDWSFAEVRARSDGD